MRVGCIVGGVFCLLLFNGFACFCFLVCCVNCFVVVFCWDLIFVGLCVLIVGDFWLLCLDVFWLGFVSFVLVFFTLYDFVSFALSFIA